MNRRYNQTLLDVFYVYVDLCNSRRSIITNSLNIMQTQEDTMHQLICGLRNANVGHTSNTAPNAQDGRNEPTTRGPVGDGFSIRAEGGESGAGATQRPATLLTTLARLLSSNSSTSLILPTYEIMLPTNELASAAPRRRGLTEADISNNCRRARFQDLTNVMNYECPISQEMFRGNDDVLQIVRCNHVFNYDSISQWFRTGNCCPLCRVDLRTLPRATETNRNTSTNDVPLAGANGTNSNDQTIQNTLQSIGNNIVGTLFESITNPSNSAGPSANALSSILNIDANRLMENNDIRHILETSNPTDISFADVMF